MGDHCCINPNTGLPGHDRLDLKQESLEFTSPVCGSVNRVTRKPDYCCFRCPTLLGKLAKGEEP